MIMMIQTPADFRLHVMDYYHREFDFKGKLPCIVVFSTIQHEIDYEMQAIGKDYSGRLDVVSVGIGEGMLQELRLVFGINTVPAILYLGKNSKPYISVGEVSLDTLKNGIDIFLRENK